MNYDIVLHIDELDPKRLKLAFTNFVNYKEALQGEEFKAVLVVNGPAVQLLTNDFTALKELAEFVKAEGLSIRVCANALRTFKIKPETIWNVCDVVPAGLVELVELQRDDFAYIRP